MSSGGNASGTRVSPVVERAARTAAIGVTVAFAVLALSQLAVPGWWGQDTDAYWDAAMRLRAGAPLYPPLASPDASDVYRYAPWFALLWVPMTYLPQVAAYAIWGVVCVGAAVFAASLSARLGGLAGWTLAILMLALLVPAAASGNVQPLLVAGLAVGVERRSGPLWIALASSLKVAPILLTAVYVGRRQWGRAAIAVAITLALVAPMLLFDLRSYPVDVAAATGPLATELALALAIVAALVAARWSGSRYAWLVAALAVVLAIPRWSYYQPSFLLIGLARRTRREP